MPCTVEMSLRGGAECARAMIYYMYESASHEWGQIEGGGARVGRHRPPGHRHAGHLSTTAVAGVQVQVCPPAKSCLCVQPTGSTVAVSHLQLGTDWRKKSNQNNVWPQQAQAGVCHSEWECPKSCLGKHCTRQSGTGLGSPHSVKKSTRTLQNSQPMCDNWQKGKAMDTR